MSNVIVKENETLDSALRRFKRSCAVSSVAVLKPAFSRKSVKESITKNLVFVVRKNLKQLENVNIINVQ